MMAKCAIMWLCFCCDTMTLPSSLSDDQVSQRLLSCQAKLRYGYLTWVLCRLLVMPWIMLKMTTTGAYGAFLLWQGFILLPALMFVPVIWQANRPYRLMVLSFLVMVYLGVATSHCLIAWYERKSSLLMWAYTLESGLLFVVLGLLFVVLKKLPPMHKTRR